MIATMMNMICFVTVLAWFTRVAKARNIYCNASYECVGQFINNSGNGSLYSLGYKANYGPTSTIYITGTSYGAYISGAFGGHRIGTLYNANNYLYASSVGAVVDATNVVDVHAVVGAAASSLARSQFLATLYFYCYSHHTCDGANITGGWKFPNNYGGRSFSNAQVHSMGDLELEFRGYYAGYNTTINCNDGDTCGITCYGNGCYGLFLNCVSGATCNVVCNESMSIDCPLTYGIDLLPNVSSNETDYEIDITGISLINDENCDSEYAVAYDNGFSFKSYGYQADNANLCCRGSESCYGTGELVISGGYDVDIICSGYGSCSFKDTISNIFGGDIFCSGASSCRSVGKIISSDNGTVYCGSIHSCSDSNIFDAEKLYCDFVSCTYNDIYGVSNVYVTGLTGASRSNIYSNGADINIYFLSYQAGMYVNVFCNTGDLCKIVCLTNNACSHTTVIYQCYDNVDVDCAEENGIDCPMVVVNNSSFCARGYGSTTTSTTTLTTTATTSVNIINNTNTSNETKKHCDDCECTCEVSCETTTDSDSLSSLLKMDHIVSRVVLGLVILCLILIIALTATCTAMYFKSKDKEECTCTAAPAPSKDVPQLQDENNNCDVNVNSTNNGELNANEQQLQHGSRKRLETQFYQDMYQASAQGEKPVFGRRSNNVIHQ